MADFNEGDRVRIIADGDGIVPVGSVGVVYESLSKSAFISVKFLPGVVPDDNDGVPRVDYPFLARELEHVSAEPEPTPTAVLVQTWDADKAVEYDRLRERMVDLVWEMRAGVDVTPTVWYGDYILDVEAFLDNTPLGL